ncbi:protein of unknown function [Candidatus Filomicrobium marinum]|nr:protein of unknown function [Candidatus Filomicrobium marinum]
MHVLKDFRPSDLPPATNINHSVDRISRSTRARGTEKNGYVALDAASNLLGTATKPVLMSRHDRYIVDPKLLDHRSH